MSTVTEHYEQLLSKHYTWMFGKSFNEKVKEQESLLSQTLGDLTKQSAGALAVDLGSGPGFQTIALAQLGFSPVIAIDTSSELLDELRCHIGSLPVQIKKADLRDLPTVVPAERATVIVCMGDTLTHLPSKPDVIALFRRVSDALHSGGIFVITYRDLTLELRGADRFIPVRSDENAIMTCFLEYENAESVLVHDLVYTRLGSDWTLGKSSYSKLRLGVDWVLQELSTAGLAVEYQDSVGRLLRVVAKKP
jgi:SAM-dependent methyltransferase